MPEKKFGLTNFLKGFTIFHSVGILLMVFGGFIGSASEELTNKTIKLRDELRAAEKTCLARPYRNGKTVREFCTIASQDIKAARAAATSLHDTALRVVGVRTTFDSLGVKMAFQITFTQVVGALVFFFELFKSLLRRRDEKEK